MIEQKVVEELLRLKAGTLFHREGQELEFKEQFSLAALADYFRDFAAFSNNRGGYLIYGVADAPRTLIGISKKSIEQFEKLDPERITGFILQTFSSDINWESGLFEVANMQFGVFRIREASTKPIIAKKDEGKDQIIKNGEIYYRYGGRTQKIQFAELESLINKRIKQNNDQWLDLMSKIGRAGPNNAAILDTEKSLIEKDNSKILVLDEDLARKLKFIKEGSFTEKSGAATLKLVGDVVPIAKVEIVKKIKEDLIKEYPLTARELAKAVREAMPGTKQNTVWRVIRDTGLKDNPDYSSYVFSSKKQKDAFENEGKLSNATPSIYKESAIDFICQVLRGE
mgnify:CR=1 FL=1